MGRDIDLLMEILAAAPDGLRRPELLRELRKKFAYIGPLDVERLVRAAGDLLLIDGDRVCPARGSFPGPQPRFRSGRFVVFDLQSIVRPIAKEPYREQHVFQVGGVRFGPDTDWVAERPEFSAFTGLRTVEDEQLIYRDELRARYEAEKRPLGEVLGGVPCVLRRC